MKQLFLILALSFFLFTGCTSAHLYVRSESYSRQDLASYKMDTPDQRKSSNDFGQRLVINWQVSESTFANGPLELVLNVRLKNGEEKESKMALKTRQGRIFYPIFGNDYTKKGGLQSYLVELKSAGTTLTSRRHKLWVQKITTASD